jgi:hypothetical protein
MGFDRTPDTFLASLNGVARFRLVEMARQACTTGNIRTKNGQGLFSHRQGWIKNSVIMEILISAVPPLAE